MELPQTILFPLLFILPLIYLCFHKFFRQNKPSGPVGRPRLPPGRTGFPLIGETLDYYFKFRHGSQFKFVRDRTDKYSSSVIRTSLIGMPMAMLCSAEGNKFLFSNEDKLVKFWLPSTITKLFPKTENLPVGGHAKSLRQILPFVLKIERLRQSVAVMDALMNQHLQAHWNGERVNVRDMAKNYVLTLAINFFLGINDQRKIQEFAEGTDEIECAIRAMPLNLPGTAFNRGMKASKTMRGQIEAMVRERKAEISKRNLSSVKDLMSHMIMAEDDNGGFINEPDTASYLTSLIQAAYGTLHSTITLVMMILAELPTVYESVLNEQKEIAQLRQSGGRLSWEDIRKMQYSWAVVREVLRIFPPGNGGFREVITDFTYEGYTIPKGWKIHWLMHATHKNPIYFPDPEKFDPSRFEGCGPAPYTFIPFGAGSRMCPGNEYSRLAILTFLHNVVTKFRWKKVVPDEKLVHYPVSRPAQGLPIRLYRHES